MSNTDLDVYDSLFIAQHIMNKLRLPLDPERIDKTKLSLKSAVLATVDAIEKIEDTWQHEANFSSHSYGRKEKDEVIKLWSVPNKSAQVLRDLVILNGAKNVLEIGTSAGYSTLFLADGAKHNEGNVTTIELLKEKATLAREFIEQSQLDNINLIEDEAGSVLKQWPKKDVIDLIFLDADKESYGKYLELLLPIMRKGALIIADNINDYGHMMEDYLQKVSGTHLPKSRSDQRVVSYYLAMLDNGLMITKKL